MAQSWLTHDGVAMTHHPHDATAELRLDTGTSLCYLSPCFVLDMEVKLRENADKRGTARGRLGVEGLYELLKIELAEFEFAHKYLGRDEAARELIDIANFCFLMWKRLRPNHDSVYGPNGELK